MNLKPLTYSAAWELERKLWRSDIGNIESLQIPVPADSIESFVGVNALVLWESPSPLLPKSEQEGAK